MSLTPPAPPEAGEPAPSGGAWSEEVARHEALLLRIAAQVSAFDGNRPGGALIGPRILLIAAQDRLADERLASLGAAIEMTRRATLAHRDPQREGPWEGFGEARFSQTLRGDVLLAEAFHLLAADGEPRVVQILARAMAGVAEGELERHTRHGEDGDRSLHLQSAYYEGVAATGALLGGLDAAQTADFVAWARVAGERHERAVAGGAPPARDRTVFERNAPFGSQALCSRMLERLGTPDVVTA